MRTHARGLIAVSAVAALVVGVVSVAHAETPREKRHRGHKAGCGISAAKLGGMPGGVIHAEIKSKGKDGFIVSTVDTGTVTATDAGDKLTIQREDGESVTVDGTDATRYCRNGKKASFSDIKKDDRVHLVRSAKQGEEQTLKAVMVRNKGDRKAGEGRKGDRRT